jgi:hypothetical protein
VLAAANIADLDPQAVATWLGRSTCRCAIGKGVEQANEGIPAKWQLVDTA